MKTLISLLFFIFCQTGFAQDLNSDFYALLKKNGLTVPANHIYCIKSEGITTGVHLDRAQEIASVSKLFTSLFALQVMDANKTYKTHIYLTSDSLHIEGSGDPYFEEEKIFYLIDALNRLGYTKFKKITFNPNFKAHDSNAQVAFKITSTVVASSLLKYFNTARYTSAVRERLKATRAFAKQENLDNQLQTYLNMSVTKVEASSINPLIDQNPAHYVHESKPLYKILKTLNVLSKNSVSQAVFDDASKMKDFKTVLNELKISTTGLEFYNGSGLPTMVGEKRYDNKASCNTVISVLEKLKLKIEASKLKLEDVIQVGTDIGTLRSRFLDNLLAKESIIAKTGTLATTSSLAGFLSSDSLIPFVILNKTSSISSDKKFQEAFIKLLFDQEFTKTTRIRKRIYLSCR
jgi:D-alanyl-D-alanine carboxypeptidase